MDIMKIDPNFKPATIGDAPVEFADVLKARGVFRLSGFPWRRADGTLMRLPETLDRTRVSEGVLHLAQHTSGGQLAFKTDSRYIVIRAKLDIAPCDMNHMPRTGSSGFDFYERTPEGYVFRKGIGPAGTHLAGEALEQLAIPAAEDRRMRSWRVNFPLYNGVRSLELGFEPGAHFEPPEPFRVAKPILFYGSSITQGGCASRPGNNYTAMLCRKLDAEQINLGFSGSAKGEIAIAEAIGTLDLAAFVLDYDHNAPNAEHLRKTHGPFFRAVRKARPDLPILMLSRGDSCNAERTAAIRETYDEAVARGDRHVYFLDGKTYFADLEDWHAATVDGCHPNDLGFYLMYQAVLPVLRRALAEAGALSPAGEGPRPH